MPWDYWGEGTRNRRILEWQILAQRKCVKLCHAFFFFRSEGFFLGVIFRAPRSHPELRKLLSKFGTSSQIPQGKFGSSSQKVVRIDCEWLLPFPMAVGWLLLFPGSF